MYVKFLLWILLGAFVERFGWCYEVCRETDTHIDYCDGSAPYCCEGDTACCTTPIPVWSIVVISIGCLLVLAAIVSSVAKKINKHKQIVGPSQYMVINTVSSEYPSQYPLKYPPHYPQQ